MWWIGAHMLALAMVFLAPGFLLQISVALTGEPAPRYGRATLTWLIASILGGITGITGGFMFGWMLPGIVSTAVAALMMLGVTTIVFKRQFGTTMVQALVVSIIYTVLSNAFFGLTWYLLGW